MTSDDTGNFEEAMTFVGGMNFLGIFFNRKKYATILTSSSEMDRFHVLCRSKKKNLGPPKQKHPFRDLLMLGTDPRIWALFCRNTLYNFINLNWRFLKRILYNFNTSLENKTLHQFTLGLKSYVKENEWHASQLIQDFAQQFHPTLLDLPSPGVSLTSKSSDLKISPPLNHNAIKPPSFDHEILLDELMVFLMWIPHVTFRNSPQIELGPVVHLGGGWESLVEVEEQELTHHWWGFNGKRRD